MYTFESSSEENRHTQGYHVGLLMKWNLKNSDPKIFFVSRFTKWSLKDSMEISQNA